MWTYITRRLLYTIPIVLGVLVITFGIFYGRTSPRDLARQEVAAKGTTEDNIAAWLRENGYAELNTEGLKKLEVLRAAARDIGKGPDGAPITNLPKITAKDTVDYSYPRLFLNYVTDLCTFDFGRTKEKRYVSEVLLAGMVPSLQMMIPAFIFSELLGVFFALFSALYRGTKIDKNLVIFSVLLMSITPVAFIMFAQKFFAADWGYFPVSGYERGIAGYSYLLLPMAIYTLISLGSLIRFNRIVMLDEIGQDYVRTAKSKGLGQNTILFKHVFRNSLIPLITHWAVAIPGLYLGSLLLESYFAIPGLGGITIAAVVNTDVNLIRALVFIGTLGYIFATLLGDVLYAVVDPRIKLS